jgi:hypothetical protein
MSAISPISLCPVNFAGLNVLRGKTQNLESAFLLAKLKFHEENTKLTKSGKRCISRSRAKITSWFKFSPRKTDALLLSLVEKDLITKRSSMWYGKKQLFISVNDAVDTAPINMKLLDTIIEITGSLKEAILLSKIAFGCANTKIFHDGLAWHAATREALSSYLEISERTLDLFTKNLVKKDLILKKNFIHNGKRQAHYHIKEEAIRFVQEQLKANDLHRSIKEKTVPTKQTVSCKICRVEPAKTLISIRIRTNSKKTINTTPRSIQDDREGRLAKKRSDIDFSHESNKFSERALRYLHGALKNTLARTKRKNINYVSLFEEMLYAIQKLLMQNKVQNFKHAVSRCMKIFTDGNWTRSFGFTKYSEYGRAQETHLQEQLVKHEACKDKRDKEGFSVNRPVLDLKGYQQEALSLATQIHKLTALTVSAADKKTANTMVQTHIQRLKVLFKQGVQQESILLTIKTGRAVA